MNNSAFNVELVFRTLCIAIFLSFSVSSKSSDLDRFQYRCELINQLHSSDFEKGFGSQLEDLPTKHQSLQYFNYLDYRIYIPESALIGPLIRTGGTDIAKLYQYEGFSVAVQVTEHADTRNFAVIKAVDPDFEFNFSKVVKTLLDKEIAATDPCTDNLVFSSKSWASREGFYFKENSYEKYYFSNSLFSLFDLDGQKLRVYKEINGKVLSVWYSYDGSKVSLDYLLGLVALYEDSH